MSNPAVQNVTAAVSQRIRKSSDPRTAIHADAGAIPSARPSTTCEKCVKRFVYEYASTTISANGASRKQSPFSSHDANRNNTLDATVKPTQNLRDNNPARSEEHTSELQSL